MEEWYSQSFHLAMSDAESVTKMTAELNNRGNEANKKDSFSWLRTWNNLLGNAKKNINLSPEEQRNLPDYHKKAIQFYVKYKLSDTLTNEENNGNIVNSNPLNCTVPCTEAQSQHISFQYQHKNFEKSCPSVQSAVPSKSAHTQLHFPKNFQPSSPASQKSVPYQEMYMFEEQQLPVTLTSARTQRHLPTNFQPSSPASQKSVPYQEMYMFEEQQLPVISTSARTQRHLPTNFKPSSPASQTVPSQQMYKLQSQPSVVPQRQLPGTSRKSCSRNDTSLQQQYLSEKKLQEMLKNLSEDEYLSDEEIYTADMPNESVNCSMNVAKKQRVEDSNRADAVGELPTFDRMHTDFLNNLQNTVVKN